MAFFEWELWFGLPCKATSAKAHEMVGVGPSFEALHGAKAIKSTRCYTHKNPPNPFSGICGCPIVYNLEG